MTSPSSAPIFVIGAPRSGTTLLRLVLDAHPHIAAGPETRFLLDLARIFGPHWHRLERFGFPREYWLEKVRAFFGGVHADYARRRGKRRWAEKTPRYVEILDLVDELFPDALYLHIVRDGLDVVASHRARWGWKRAYGAIDDWRRLVVRARRFGERVGPGRFLEVRYEEVVTRPEEVLRSVFAFLDEPFDPRVLRFHEVEHDLPEAARTRMERLMESGGDSPLVTSRIGAGSRELDPLLRLLFRIRSGRLRRRLGYPWRGASR